MPTLQDTLTVWWEDGAVRMIDQRALPERLVVLRLRDYREVADAIRTMAVRGAPAIGVAAALGLALAAREAADTPPSFDTRLREADAVLRATRPTAVNLFWGLDRVLTAAARAGNEPAARAAAALDEACRMAEEDIRANRALASHGATLLPQGGHILTHCNTGSLATVHYGTALGVIRAAWELGNPVHVWVDETRPRLQGLRLTAWECRQLGLPHTVIADGAAAWLMRQGRVDAAIVGADRIAANGDTANKIGTYSVAVNARAHHIPFYVAAPLSTVDFSLPDGSGIPIEERESSELTRTAGQLLAPADTPVLNPAFDVTPGELITAIITERGVARPPFCESLHALRRLPPA